MKLISDHGKSIRRIAAVLCALALLFSVTGFADAGPADLSRLCSATFLAGGDQGEYGEDVDLAQVQVDLYLVAGVENDPGDTGLHFNREQAFRNLEIPDEPSRDTWDALAAQAGQIIRDRLSTLTPAASAPIGTAITDLEPGLYAAIAHGADLTDYFREIADENGEDVLVSLAKSPRWEYYFEPELIVLPTKEVGEDGTVSTAKGEWIYDAEYVLKSSRAPRVGSLEIVKTLQTYLAPEEAMFVFSVTIEVDGVAQPTRVYSLNFTDAGQQRLVLEDIPAGAVVTVTELYEGSTYTLISDPEVTAVIEADTLASVEFINDYTPGPGGHGVENHFTLDDDGWNWEQRPDSRGK